MVVRPQAEILRQHLLNALSTAEFDTLAFGSHETEQRTLFTVPKVWQPELKLSVCRLVKVSVAFVEGNFCTGLAHIVAMASWSIHSIQLGKCPLEVPSK